VKTRIRSKMVSATLGLVASLSIPAVSTATYNATVIGTVVYVQQDSPSVGYTPETFTFTVTNQPNLNCGSGFAYFVVSPNSVTDAQTRKNLLTLVLFAKATGGQIEVAYDKNGGFCDQGMIGVYYVVAL